MTLLVLLRASALFGGAPGTVAGEGLCLCGCRFTFARFFCCLTSSDGPRASQTLNARSPLRTVGAIPDASPSRQPVHAVFVIALSALPVGVDALVIALSALPVGVDALVAGFGSYPVGLSARLVAIGTSVDDNNASPVGIIDYLDE